MGPRLVGAFFFFDEVPLRAADARAVVADVARFFFDELPLDAAAAETASSMEEENKNIVRKRGKLKKKKNKN